MEIELIYYISRERCVKTEFCRVMREHSYGRVMRENRVKAR